jgi:anti-sigma B factor antagonist
MEIKNETLHGISVIRASGKIDATTVPVFESAVKSVSAQGAKKILIDLSSLVYINSGGLRVVLATAKIQKNSGGMFALSGLTPEVNKVFTLAGLDTILMIFPAEADAIARMM